MLTRAQVAKRLGKSIATVRRMERDKLHPTIGERGVHWFDEAEVAAVEAEIATTGRALPPGSLDASANVSGPTWEEFEDLQNELQSARHQADQHLCRTLEAKEKAERALDQLRGECASWARDVDLGCALVLRTKAGPLHDRALDCLIELLDRVPGSVK